jgi:membrane-bound serine protease (ClpP class)
MDALLEPNVAYLFLVAGTLLAILGLLSPGTGIIEIGALFILLIAGWQAYNLPLNVWALGILVLGVVPFVFAVRRSRQLIYLVIAIVAFLVGSIFLYRGDTLWQPAVNPLLALLVSILATGFMWLVVTKITEAEQALPTHDLEALVGKRGEVRAVVGDELSVQVSGELWSARSSAPLEEPMQVDEEIIVTGREGFFLLVDRLPGSERKDVSPQESS